MWRVSKPAAIYTKILEFPHPSSQLHYPIHPVGNSTASRPVNRCTGFPLGFLHVVSCGAFWIFCKFCRVPLVFVWVSLGFSVLSGGYPSVLEGFWLAVYVFLRVSCRVSLSSGFSGSLLGFLLVKFGLLPVPACLRVSVYMFPAGFASFHAQQGVPGCRGAITWKVMPPICIFTKLFASHARRPTDIQNTV